MRLRTILSVLVAVGWLMLPVVGQSAVRVALMDFATDENSYRALQAAANLTSLVQTKLGSLPDFEWVERSQIRLPQAELALAEALGNGGASALRQGRMLGANWLVQGQLSTDDDDRPAVRLEVVDLAHADVLAATTISLPAATVAGRAIGDDAAEAVAAALRPLLATARSKAAEAAPQARVALLFLMHEAAFPFDGRAAGMADWFQERLQQWAATNGRVRVIQFPRAYSATAESELALDGFTGAEAGGWRHLADL
jgi:hypothetical protein